MGQSWEAWHGIESEEKEAPIIVDESKAVEQIHQWAQTLPRRSESSDEEIAVDALKQKLNASKFDKI